MGYADNAVSPLGTALFFISFSVSLLFSLWRARHG